MRKIVILLSLLVVSLQALDKEYVKVVQPLIEAFKSKDKSTIINLVTYPLKRQYPIPSIKNKEEMLLRFNEVFDAKLSESIAQSDIQKDWESVGWRGIMFSYGQLWLVTTGKIFSVNYHSVKEQEIKAQIIAKQKENLHQSVKIFKKAILEWKTKRFHIRIDDLGDENYRYAAWPVHKKTSAKPDIVLEKGKVVYSGSGGNHHYEFTNGAYTYQCDVTVIGADDSPPGSIEVLKNGKRIFYQNVIEVMNL